MKFCKVLLGLVLIGVATSAVAAQLAVSISPAVDKSVVTPAEGAMVRFVITNTSDRELSFLRYNTPLGGFESNLFLVEKDGKTVPYIGKLAMRLGPTPDDWVTIAEGESVEALVNLAEAYDLRTGGNYTIRYRFPIGVRNDNARESMASTGELPGHLLEDVESNTVAVVIDGPAMIEEVEQVAGPERAYSGCTTSQQSSLATSRTSGQNLAARSYNQLNGASGSTNSLYKTWFGTYTSSRYSTVKTGYYNIYYAFNTTWTYTCTSCESGVIAYVYPNQTYKVWICAAFFNYDSTQRGSFLLHESSHWTAVRGTDDYTYGSANCKNLAISSPSKAVYNADSYRYFSLYAP
jgi:peptidyl-Lys metalloendopeptidase